MKAIYRSRHLYWFLGVAALVGAAVGARLVTNPLPASAGGTAPTGAGKGVVLFGHVDTEHGLASLYPLVPGRVTRVEVAENQAVKAGTVLVRLDDYQARRQVQEAEADLAAAREQADQTLKLPKRQRIRLAQQRAAIEAVRHRLEGARTVLAHKRLLEQKKLVGASEAEAASALVRELEALERVEKGRLRELELNDSSAGGRTARANLAAKQARLDQARRTAQECALKAPVDGTVLRVLVGPGDVLDAQPRQPAVLFCPAGPRIIRAEVEQEFAGRVAVGQVARIQDDARGGPTWRGKVLRVADWYTQRRASRLDPSQLNDVRTLECIIALDPGQPGLRLGQRVRVRLLPVQP